MDRETYNKLVENLIEKTRDTLVNKNKEYAPGDMPLVNFYRSADILALEPELVALGFQTKHITSVIDMLQSQKDYPLELWEEKLGDMINYCILIYCLIYEKKMDHYHHN